jgi:hypothetical protein
MAVFAPFQGFNVDIQLAFQILAVYLCVPF